MAAVHAGVKRAYHEISGTELDYRSSGSRTTSRAQSPVPPYSRASSRGPDPGNLDLKIVLSGIAPRQATFEPSASLVLIGVRGVGKSTLGVLAATAYNRRLIDSEKGFLEATGSTTNAYRKSHGTKTYQEKHSLVFQSILENHSAGSVIVCNFSDLENKGATLLRDYAQTHPIIHVSRDAKGIRSHLQVWTTERINALVSASAPLLRSCSNYEFYNLSEEINGDHSLPRSEQSSTRTSNGSFLTLKRVERDFLRLLRNVIGDDHRGVSHHSVYPLSQINIKDRPYTFAVDVNVSEIVAHSIDSHLDLDEMQIGADCIRLVVDLDYSDGQSVLNRIAQAFSIIRRATILPVLLSVSNLQRFANSQHSTLYDLTEYCLRLAPELCAVDLCLSDSQLRQFVASKRGSTIIGTAELPQCLPEGWRDKRCIDTYIRAASLGCDLVRITMPAQDVEDAFAIQSFQRKVVGLDLKRPLIAYATGSKGRLSKCFNKILTSVNAFEPHSHTAYNQHSNSDSLGAKAITEALFATFVHQPMHFYVYGADVSYSLSPALHNAAYAMVGMPHAYSAHSSASLDYLAELVRNPNFGGAALATPFKTSVISMLDVLSPHAKAIGAVNTVVPIRELTADGVFPNSSGMMAQRNQGGPVKALYGYNTDWIGIRASIRKGLSPANTIRPQSSAVVCGSGGMGRSAIYSLISLGVENIIVCNRTLENAVVLAEHYNKLIDSGEIFKLSPGAAKNIRIQVLETFESDWPSEMRQPTMIVCCIPRQTSNGSPVNFTLPEAWLKSPTGGVVVEVAYGEPRGHLTHQITSRAKSGWIFLDGFDVIPEQAYSQFELFTGRRAPRKLMKNEMMKHSAGYRSSSNGTASTK